MDISLLTKDRVVAWVPFEEGVEVQIRFVPRSELVAIGKASVVVTIDPRTKKETRDYDAIGADIRIAKAAIVDWRGLVVDGKPFPCTPENIELLISKWAEFSAFVGQACVDVTGFGETEREQAEKN